MNNILVHNGQKFIIGSYALSMALKSIGFTMSDFEEAIDTHFFDLTHAVIFYSAEYAAMKDGVENSFKKSDVYDLLDQTGGYGGEFLVAFNTLMVENLRRVGPPENLAPAEQDGPAGKKKNSRSKGTA